MKKTKSRSHNQHKLKILSDKICDRIDDLLSYFNLEYKASGKLISMSCPIHGGDNSSAFNLYPEGEKYRGNWKCRTHGCEEIFKSSIIGFIRGVLSHQDYGWTKDGEKAYSFEEAIAFSEKFLNQKVSDIKIDKKHIEKTNFVNTVSYINNKADTIGPQIGHNQIRKSLQIPSKYFLGRGFSETILEKYDVGDCIIRGKEMANRAVVPVYDMDNKYMVGCTGRSVFEKCKECNCHHQNDQPCPKDKESWLMSKWRHNKDFKTQEHLYNFWFAKEYIQKLKMAIIVESPGNVWRLEEAGIHNSVAVFGSSLSYKQKILLDISGALSLVLLMDNDDAGKKAVDNIKAKCNKTYNIFAISIQYDDIASMSVDQIKHEIIPQIEKII